MKPCKWCEHSTGCRVATMVVCLNEKRGIVPRGYDGFGRPMVSKIDTCSQYGREPGADDDKGEAENAA